MLSSSAQLGITWKVTNTPSSQSGNACTHPPTHVSQGNGTEEKVFEKRKVFKEDLKELTEVE